MQCLNKKYLSNESGTYKWNKNLQKRPIYKADNKVIQTVFAFVLNWESWKNNPEQNSANFKISNLTSFYNPYINLIDSLEILSYSKLSLLPLSPHPS